MNAIFHEAASRAWESSCGCIDAGKPFIAEQFTPLFHTREYGSLPAEVRLRYNQLHALYFNEQVAFFEQELLSPALLALLRASPPPALGEALRMFFEEEQRHTALFRALNRRSAPELYGQGDYFFIQVPRALRLLLGAVASRPRVFPLILWLALLQEERSLHYSKGCLERADVLEPHFVAAHRTHLADEIGHVGWDEQLLDWLWPRTGRALRWANVRLFAWMVGEFFHLPKRSGLRVVTHLVKEHPGLDGPALCGAMAGLERDGDYLRTLYSRQIAPRSFARYDAQRDFALLAKTLPGYRAPGSPQ